MDDIQPTRLNRVQLHRLAERYSTDAAALLEQGCWSSAYYLAGYAVECALKACIAKQFREHNFPDLKTTRSAHTHSLDELLKLAGLREVLIEEAAAAVRERWSAVAQWSEAARYTNWTEGEAKGLVGAINDDQGILQWLKTHW